MGAGMTQAGLISQRGDAKLRGADFTPLQLHQTVPVMDKHDQLFLVLRKKFEITDSRTIPRLQWFVSQRLNMYLYGSVETGRPSGPCFFYAKDHEIKQTPLLMAATINKKLSTSKGLVIYSDRSFYFGQLSTSRDGFMGACGRGQLVSFEHVFQGQFKEGLPHGFGHFTSPNLQYVGEFVNGWPKGDGIGKNSHQVFIGQVLQQNKRKGIVISDMNQVSFFDEKGQKRAATQAEISEMHVRCGRMTGSQKPI